MSTTAWAHLPNAAHIDWVLHTLHSHPQVWHVAWDNTRDSTRLIVRDAAQGAAHAVTRDAAHAVTRAAARGAAWDAAWDAARVAACDAAWDAARVAACDTTWSVAQDATQDALCTATWAATHALIAWDDAGRWLRTHWSAAHMATDAGDHAAVLLLPAAHVAWELGYSRKGDHGTHT